jgi:hypothetical protein
MVIYRDKKICRCLCAAFSVFCHFLVSTEGKARSKEHVETNHMSVHDNGSAAQYTAARTFVASNPLYSGLNTHEVQTDQALVFRVGSSVSVTIRGFGYRQLKVDPRPARASNLALAIHASFGLNYSLQGTASAIYFDKRFRRGYLKFAMQTDVALVRTTAKAGISLDNRLNRLRFTARRRGTARGLVRPVP